MLRNLELPCMGLDIYIDFKWSLLTIIADIAAQSGTYGFFSRNRDNRTNRGNKKKIARMGVLGGKNSGEILARTMRRWGK